MHTFKKYKKAEAFLFSQLAMYQNHGSKAMKKGLDNITRLSNYLENPHHAYPTVHIAGTNGKGSVAHMVASIFQANGYCVGLYTSPHYNNFRERIKVNGKLIKKRKVVQFVNSAFLAIELIRPTFFEITVSMAFSHFKDKKVDIAIVETGMGGRLDSTNILNPILSIITNISFDHQSSLGSTLDLIAEEKAGIIKKNVPVIIGEKSPNTSSIFHNKASLENARLHWAGDMLDFQKSKKRSSLMTIKELSTGKTWLRNAAISAVPMYNMTNWRSALCAIYLLKSKWKLKNSKILKGIKDMAVSTQYMGRYQIIKTQPLTIADAAHNAAGLESLMLSIKQLNYSRIHVVIGMVKGKDHESLLTLLPKKAKYYFCKADMPRSMNQKQLQKKAKSVGLKGTVYTSVKKALKASTKACHHKNDIILVTGSSFVVGEIID